MEEKVLIREKRSLEAVVMNHKSRIGMGNSKRIVLGSTEKIVYRR